MPSMDDLIVAVKKVYLQIYYTLVETVNLQTVIFFVVRHLTEGILRCPNLLYASNKFYCHFF